MPTRRRGALLLERLHHEDLGDLWDLEACEVVAGLYRKLHVPAVPQLRPLTSYVERWSADLAALPRSAPLPRRLVEQAVSLSRDLVADPASTGTMIHTDLHYENVLAGDREPWLAIDPKPVSGDPHYEPAPDAVEPPRRADRQPRAEPAHGAAAALPPAGRRGGLDEHRARDWVVVRMMHNALWRLQDEPGTVRLTPTDDYLTACIAIAKAVQD